MLMPMTVEDIVVGIFYHLKDHAQTKLTADRELLHRAFYQIKEQCPELMSMFTFREREQFPESIQLDQALSNLDAAGVISRQNFTPKYYVFEPTLERSYDKYSKKLLVNAGFGDDVIEHATRLIEPIVCGNA